MTDEKVWRSPNFKSRANNEKPSLIVLHASVGKSDVGDLSWLCDPKSGVSYHVLVGRDGTAHQLVDYDKQAYHAGESEWRQRKYCNQFSIGLAFSNRHDGVEMLTAAQIRTMQTLIRDISKQYPIKAVVTHQDVAPGRKTDPTKTPNFYAKDYALPT